MRGGGNSEPLNSRVLRNRKICNISGLKNEFFAFTLAEVLITLGIIGVVAAITMPSIVSNIQGMQYRSKVKKTYSALVQAVSLAKANYDVDLDTLETACVDGENDKLPSTYSVCALFNSTLSGAKYISETDPNHPKNYNKAYTSNGSSWSPTPDFYHVGYQLADGSVVVFNLDFTIGGIYGYIDVNGKKGPNKLTRGKNPKPVEGCCATSESYLDYAGTDTIGFPSYAYNGKPDQFYDNYFFRIPMRNFDYSGSYDNGALRYVMTH